MPDRERCYADIRDGFERGIAGYYEHHPDLVDTPTVDALTVAAQYGLTAVLDVLERYNLTRKREP